jgi:hypothetical protein
MALVALAAEAAGAADAVLTASGEAVVRRAGRADPEDVTMFPQESQGLRMVNCNCGYSGELRSKPVSDAARAAEESRLRVVRRTKSSRMRRIDARTTVLGLLAATRVTIDAAMDGSAWMNPQACLLWFYGG